MKNTFQIVLMIILSALFIMSCDNSERDKAAGEKLKGSAQETVGSLTNDNEIKNKGKTNRTKGDLRSTKEDVKDLITGN